MSKRMTRQEVIEAVAALNKAYPDGWRSGDPTSDALMVIMINDARKIGKAIFGAKS